MGFTSMGDLRDDSKLVVDPNVPFGVQDKYAALQFSEALDEDGGWLNFTDLATLLATHERDVIERIAEEYDGSDVAEAKELCEEIQSSEDATEILGDLDTEYSDVDAEIAREAREKFEQAIEKKREERAKDARKDDRVDYPDDTEDDE